MAHHNRRRKWINQQRQIAQALVPYMNGPQPFGIHAFAALHRYFQMSTPYDNHVNVEALIAKLKAVRAT